MNRASVFSTSVLMALGVALLPSNVVGQQKSIKEQLVGTWTFVFVALSGKRLSMRGVGHTLRYGHGTAESVAK